MFFIKLRNVKDDGSIEVYRVNSTCINSYVANDKGGSRVRFASGNVSNVDNPPADIDRQLEAFYLIN